MWLDKPARLSFFICICQAQQKWKQILRRKCCLDVIWVVRSLQNSPELQKCANSYPITSLNSLCNVHILHPACRCGEKACALIISHEDKRVFLHWEHWYNFYTLSQQAGGPWQHRNGWISCCTLNSLSCWHSKRKTMYIRLEKIQNNDE